MSGRNVDKLPIEVEELKQKVDQIIEGGTIGILSTPSEGKKKITNLSWDPVTGEIVINKEE